jgi:glycosyltransferase involved in cell wall biosynthesis
MAMAEQPAPGESAEEAADARVAVVIPCHDEASSIARVVGDFRTALPEAEVVVVDNASTDDTAADAAEAGARVLHESRLGKGFALLTGFAAVPDADHVVMVDGDDTYPAASVNDLLQAARESNADVVIATRLEAGSPGAFRPGHSFGNRIFIALVRLLFGIRTRDLFSGYRVLSRRFLDTAPLVATGFDVEAEISVQAQVHGFQVLEIPVEYRARAGASRSKLRTFQDGFHIAREIMILFRDHRPMVFFGLLCVLLMGASFWSGWPAIDDYLRTGLVHHLPRAVLAAALFILAALSLSLGVLLSSINRRAVELAALIRKRGR